MSRRMPIERIDAEARLGKQWGPFDNTLPTEPIPTAASITYAFGPDVIDIGPSRVATPSTYVEFEGRTAYGDSSRLPFHVSSADWQESDRFLAGLMTAFGNPTNAIPIGGYGTFDGIMLNSFSRPRIEGTFAGERMRAFGVVWGAAKGSTVIENSYADVKDVVLNNGDSAIYADGRFSLGYPRRDNGEEINAIVRIIKRPVADLRHAFVLDDYPVEGVLSGEFHVYGAYTRPFGFGTMAIADGVAYHEPFETATAVCVWKARSPPRQHRGCQGGGRDRRCLRRQDSTYRSTSTCSARSRALRWHAHRMPRHSGFLDFTAGGSGTRRRGAHPAACDSSLPARIGTVTGDININNDLMALKLEAASPRLAVSGSGTIALSEQMDADRRSPLGHIARPVNSLSIPHCRPTRLRSPAAASG